MVLLWTSIAVLLAHPLATLLYTSEVKDLKAGDLTQMITAVNNKIRNVWFSRWQSIRDMRLTFDHKSVTEIFAIFTIFV